VKDAFTSAVYRRDGDEFCGPGIYVEFPAWGLQYLEWL